MRRFNLSSPADFMALMVRRKWWIVLPFVALSCAALLLTYMLPKVYVSEATVLIRPRDLSKDFVKDLISGTTEQRVSTIEQIVLSRTSLLKILTEFEADFPEYRSLDNDLKVAKFRRQIKTDFNIETQIGKEEIPLTFFRISYRNRVPALAQKITDKVTGLFIEQDNRVREAQVVGTTDFLADKVEKARVALAESDTKLKVLKSRRPGSLPEQLTTNLAMLNSAVDQKKLNLEARDRYATELANVNRDISNTPPKLIVPKANVVNKVVRNPLLDDYIAARTALKAVVADGKTASHPDFTAATNRLEKIKSQIPPAELAALDNPVEAPALVRDDEVPNPAYQALISQKDRLETELQLRERAVKSADIEIEKYNQRIQSAPQSEQDMAGAIRENSNLNTEYQELNGMLNKARLSESAESSQKGSQFVVVDPANYPIAPAKPAKPLIAGMGVMLSLLIGIAIAIAVDLANQKMWTLSDVENLVGAPVLVEIPEIITPADLKTGHRKRKTHIALLAVASAVYGVCLYFVYTHQSGVLSRLDPVITRFY